MKMMRLVPWLGVWLLALPALVPAQESKLTFDQVVKNVEARFEPAEAKPGQTVTLKVEVNLLPDWHTYPTSQPDSGASQQINRLTLPPPGDLIFVGSVQNPPSPAKMPKSELPEGVNEIFEYPGGGIWEHKAVVSPTAQVGEATVEVRFRILVCQKSCFPPKIVSRMATLRVVHGRVDVDPQYRTDVEQALSKVAPLPPPPPEGPYRVGLRIQTGRNYQENLNAVAELLPPTGSNDAARGGTGAGTGSFVTLLLTAMFWGLVTLLTPCVFPMIPITVSFFLKQGEKQHHNALATASVYALTIVAVLGIAAVTLLSVFRALSIDPWMNIFLGALFIFFALSLFGMYEIVLPNSLVRFTSAREGMGGYTGTIFMALSFTIISFTCVAPFLGGFSGMTASGNFTKLQLALGGVAFAATFAAPFFFLALFPSLLKKLPKSGSWMNTVKVVMGFLELAAALKFFRTAELRWQIPPAIFSYDFVLAMWVAILVLMGLYLLNVYRLPHDESQAHIGVPRMLFGFLSLSLAVYLMPAVFSSGESKPRPGGVIYAWVDSFLLPDQGKDEFVWSADLRAAIEDARSKNQLVFVDFTGVTCTNCKLNEKNIFPRPEVRELMHRYHLVQLYTDTVPGTYYDTVPSLARQEEDAQANLEFQRKRFGTEQLPLYVILRPQPGSKEVTVVGPYEEGKINNEAAFVEFLKRPLENK
jgi:cytochrome c biogenesis protein CcdA/thioredoxin-related protein